MGTKFKILGYKNPNKMAMTKAFRKYSNLGLEGSKRMTDSLLKDGLLECKIKDSEKAQQLVNELIKANANVSTSD